MDQHRHIRALLARRQERYIFWTKFFVAVDIVCALFCAYQFACSRTWPWVEMAALSIGLTAGALYDLHRMRETLDRTRNTLV